MDLILRPRYTLTICCIDVDGSAVDGREGGVGGGWGVGGAERDCGETGGEGEGMRDRRERRKSAGEPAIIWPVPIMYYQVSIEMMMGITSFCWLLTVSEFAARIFYPCYCGCGWSRCRTGSWSA